MEATTPQQLDAEIAALWLRISDLNGSPAYRLRRGQLLNCVRRLEAMKAKAAR